VNSWRSACLGFSWSLYDLDSDIAASISKSDDLVSRTLSIISTLIDSHFHRHYTTMKEQEPKLPDRYEAKKPRPDEDLASSDVLGSGREPAGRRYRAAGNATRPPSLKSQGEHRNQPTCEAPRIAVGSAVAGAGEAPGIGNAGAGEASAADLIAARAGREDTQDGHSRLIDALRQPNCRSQRFLRLRLLAADRARRPQEERTTR
jgi:hypothetical protein